MIHFNQSLPAEAFYHVPLHFIMRGSGCQFQTRKQHGRVSGWLHSHSCAVHSYFPKRNSLPLRVCKRLDCLGTPT